MFYEMKAKIDRRLSSFLKDLDKRHGLSRLSPLLSRKIKDFVLRKGKRLRPILFTLGYLSFAKKPAPGLYTSALSMELLHDFLLVHDDIIDKSDTRRGKPSMHAMFNKYLSPFKNIKFGGQDLSLVAGDIIYAAAIEAFLSIKERPARKEKALLKFTQAAVFTGSGEFIELLEGLKPLEKVTKQAIYRIYDYKTSYYSFSTPLATGAVLAGASPREIDKLLKFGIYLGRAFQIKDDILGIFGDEKRIGKSTLTDLQEAKKTLLIWYAFCHSSRKEKTCIKQILRKKRVSKKDLLNIKKIIKDSGALRFANNEVARLIDRSKRLLGSCRMKPKYKKHLLRYSEELLAL